MSVLYLSAGLRDVVHALLAELAKLGERPRLVVAALVYGGEHAVVFGYYIILQLAHGLVSHAGRSSECRGGSV